MKINARWKVPHGKLIGSPGRFFNHNRLWHRLGLRAGWQKEERGAGPLPGGSPGARWGHASCPGPARWRGGEGTVVPEGGLELQTWLQSCPNASCWLPLGQIPSGRRGYPQLSPCWSWHGGITGIGCAALVGTRFSMSKAECTQWGSTAQSRGPSPTSVQLCCYYCLLGAWGFLSAM